MICIKSSSADPRFNLAAEEYLLRKTRQEFFILYRNNPSVIIGKHQNALAELNLPYVNEYGIPVIRRISGGGTVYHDPGNLNYCFIRKGIKGQMVDFIKHTGPVIDFLATLGLKAEFDGRNSLLLQGKKISGNAEHVFQDRVLHHGTLLFSSDLDRLSEALRIKTGSYKDRAIKSIRSLVTNLSDHLGGTMDINSFTDKFMDFVKAAHPSGSGEYEYTPGDLEEIEQLVDEKYSRWEWNYGYSPKYSFNKETRLLGRTFRIRFDVEKGILKDVEISGEVPDKEFTNRLRMGLSGQSHSQQVLREILGTPGMVPGEYDIEELLNGLF